MVASEGTITIKFCLRCDDLKTAVRRNDNWECSACRQCIREPMKAGDAMLIGAVAGVFISTVVHLIFGR